jgi:hypothetical protein
MRRRSLYTIAFHEQQFTSQLELSDLSQLRATCENAKWFKEFVLPRMLEVDSVTAPGVSFQLITLDGLRNVWMGFWNHGAKQASFTLVKTQWSKHAV